MPTRHPSPGPSTPTTPSDVLQPHNAKKRGVSEMPPDEEPRQSKKHRKELELFHSDDKSLVNGSTLKDSKKKRKKKKRKSPLTIPGPEVDCLEPPAASRWKALASTSAESSTTLSETSITLPATSIAPESMVHVSSNAVSLGIVVEGEFEKHISNNLIDKGKAKALSEYPDKTISQPDGSAPVAGPSHETDSLKAAQNKIAELTAQLQSQRTLLSRHEDNLSQLQQSLTCEICLDLLYKPFSLSPCGHVACYMCLIRWFTSAQNNGNGHSHVDPPAGLEDVPALLNSRTAVRGVFLRHRKACPLCRAPITQRPSEIWSIKSMVANLVKSNLADLPSAPPTLNTETPDANPSAEHRNDPWRNVFRRGRQSGQHHDPPQFYPPPPGNNEPWEDGWGIEDMGMYDQEDGGIYRCLDCMHEIWGGVCTNCQRVYGGHSRFNEDDDDFDDGEEDDMEENFLERRLRQIWQGYDDTRMGIWGPDDDEEDEDGELEDDDEDDAEGEFYDAHGDPMELTDESDSDDDSGLDETHTGDDRSDDEWTTEDEDNDDNPEDFPSYPLTHLDIARMISDNNRRTFYDSVVVVPSGHIEEVDNDDDDDDDDDNDDEYRSQSDSAASHPNSETHYRHNFIDDGEESEEVDSRTRYPSNNRGDFRWHRGDGYSDLEVVYQSEGSVEEGGDSNHRAIARQLGRGMRLGAGSRATDFSPPPPAINRPRTQQRRRTRQQSPVNIGDAEADEDDSSVVPTRSRRTSQRQVVYDTSDGGPEEEDVRPAGARSARVRRGGRSGRVRSMVHDVD